MWDNVGSICATCTLVLSESEVSAYILKCISLADMC